MMSKTLNDTYRGYLCLVQYCPNLSRQEVINVGVLLSCLAYEFVGTVLTLSSTRECRVFGGLADLPEHIDTMKQEFAGRVREKIEDLRFLEHLQSFSREQCNKIILTAPRAVRVGNDPEKTLSRLFKERVEEPVSREQPTRKSLDPANPFKGVPPDTCPNCWAPGTLVNTSAFLTESCKCTACGWEDAHSGGCV